MDSYWESLGERHAWSEFLFRYDEVVGAESEGDLLGVGVFFTGLGPRPLLLANARIFDEYERATSPFRPLRLAEIDDSLHDRLRLDAPPEDLLVMSVQPPEPTAGHGAWVPKKTDVIVSSTKERGTLGPAVQLDEFGTVFMTAGHLLGGKGSQVDLVVNSQGEVRHLYLGDVVHRSDPAHTGAAGYDVGLIEPVARVQVHSQRIADLGQDQEAPFPATLRGGRSGVQHGFVQGALKVHSDGSGTRRWANSWMLMPGSIGAEGDSGASVTGPRSEVIGIQVGGSRITGSRSFGVLYVHDLAALLKDLFR